MRVSKRSSTCVSTKSRSGLGGAHGFDLADPFLLLAAREIGAIVEKRAQARGVGLARIGTAPSDRSRAALRNSARTSSFMGVKRAGLAAPSSDSKYSSARLTPSQSKRPIKLLARPCDTAAKQSRIAQVHELAPVELGVLQDGGLLAPLRMIVPEFFADVRQLQPHVHQDRLCDGRPRSGGAGIRRSRDLVRSSASRRRAARRCPPCASARRSSPGRRASDRRRRRKPTSARLRNGGFMPRSSSACSRYGKRS